MLINGEITRQHIEELLSAPPGQPLVLCSGGGDTTTARAMVDLLLTFPRDTLTFGECGSAAVPIFVAGRRRIVGPSTSFLWHEPYETLEDSDGQQLSIARLRQDLEDLSEWFRWANRLLAGRTKRGRDWWARLGRSEGSTFGSETALKVGLATGQLGELPVDVVQALLDTPKPRDDVASGEPDGEEDGDDVGD